MTNKDDLHKKTQDLKDELVALHKKSGLPGELIDFTKYEPALALCDELVKSVPEFRQYKNYSTVENDGKSDSYLYFGIFGQFLTEEIQVRSESELIRKAFEFINSAYNNTQDVNIRTMFGTEVFENLTLSKQTIDTAKKNLEGDALDQFGKALS